MITSGDWYRDERALVNSAYQPPTRHINSTGTSTDNTAPSDPPIQYDPYQVVHIKSRPSTPDLRLLRAKNSDDAPSSNYSYAPLSHYSHPWTSSYNSYAPSSNFSNFASSNERNLPGNKSSPHSRANSMDKKKFSFFEVSC